MKLQFILGFLGGRRQKVNVYWGGDKCFEVKGLKIIGLDVQT